MSRYRSAVRTRRSLFFVTFAAALCLAIGWGIFTETARGEMVDFAAFYCGSAIAADGGDPYDPRRLGACEHRLARANVFAASDLVVPDPLPPYAIALSEPLAHLPYQSAALLWRAILVVAFGVTIVALRRLTALPWLALVASLAIVDGMVSVALGEIVPLILAAVALCALALEQRRWWLAAGCALATTVEPHLGCAVCLGLALTPARMALAVSGTVAAVAAFAAAPPARYASYLSVVLPEHARSEVNNYGQFSATWLLHAAGMPEPLALVAGSLSFFALLLATLIAAHHLLRAGARPAYAVFLPVAATTFGGLYMHVAQIAAAVPLALLLLSERTVQTRVVLLAVVAGVAVPWILVGIGLVSPVIATLVVLALAVAFVPDPRIARVAAPTITFAVATALVAAFAHHRIPFGAVIAPVHAAALESGSMSATWRAFSDAQAAYLPVWLQLAAKLPTWIALATLLVLAVGMAGRRASPQEAKAR